jgi:hypothetical protein
MIPYLIQYYQVILQTGENKVFKDFENIYKDKQKLSKKIQHRFHPIKYINSEEVGFVYKNMDLFIGRAGANTVYELGILKKPSILIPIPWTRENEQQKNAELLENLNLAKILPEGELTPDKLFIEMYNLWIKNKEGWFLTAREVEVLNKTTIDNQDVIMEEELINKQLEYDPYGTLTSSEIAIGLMQRNIGLKTNTKRIGMTLKKLGYNSVLKKNNGQVGRFYLLTFKN